MRAEKQIPNGFGGYSTREELRTFIKNVKDRKKSADKEFNETIHIASQALETTDKILKIK